MDCPLAFEGIRVSDLVWAQTTQSGYMLSNAASALNGTDIITYRSRNSWEFIWSTKSRCRGARIDGSKCGGLFTQIS